MKKVSLYRQVQRLVINLQAIDDMFKAVEKIKDDKPVIYDGHRDIPNPAIDEKYNKADAEVIALARLYKFERNDVITLVNCVRAERAWVEQLLMQHLTSDSNVSHAVDVENKLFQARLVKLDSRLKCIFDAYNTEQAPSTEAFADGVAGMCDLIGSTSIEQGDLSALAGTVFNVCGLFDNQAEQASA